MLETTAGVEQVGEATSGEEAIRLTSDLLPDVLLMDVRMPGLDGIEASRQITARTPSVAVLVMTMYDDDDTVFAAMRAGARGYLLKGAGNEEIVRAIFAVASGEAIFGAAIANRVLRHFTQGNNMPGAPFPDLTPREREVLSLLANGESNMTISLKLGLTSKTVANHISNILNKLQAVDRAEAIIRARRAGLGD